MPTRNKSAAEGIHIKCIQLKIRDLSTFMSGPAIVLYI